MLRLVVEGRRSLHSNTSLRENASAPRGCRFPLSGEERHSLRTTRSSLDRTSARRVRRTDGVLSHKEIRSGGSLHHSNVTVGSLPRRRASPSRGRCARRSAPSSRRAARASTRGASASRGWFPAASPAARGSGLAAAGRRPPAVHCRRTPWRDEDLGSNPAENGRSHSAAGLVADATKRTTTRSIVCANMRHETSILP